MGVDPVTKLVPANPVNEVVGVRSRELILLLREGVRLKVSALCERRRIEIDNHRSLFQRALERIGELLSG